jgi:oxalate decarboxylase/phosphoglucose isomerase-like protein (cupin superfamily)
MTVFNTGPNAMTMDFNAGDIGYVRRNLGHYVENVGDTDLQFIGVFKASRQVVDREATDGFRTQTRKLMIRRPAAGSRGDHGRGRYGRP